PPTAEELIEEVLEERVVGTRPRDGGWTAAAGQLHGADVDHGGADALGDGDEGGLQGVGGSAGVRAGQGGADPSPRQESVHPEPETGQREKNAGNQRGS